MHARLRQLTEKRRCSATGCLKRKDESMKMGIDKVFESYGQNIMVNFTMMKRVKSLQVRTLMVLH